MSVCGRDTRHAPDGSGRVTVSLVQRHVCDAEPVKERPGRGPAVPPDLNPDGSRHNDLDWDRATLPAGDNLQVTDDPAMFRMSRITEGPDGLRAKNDQLTHAA